MTNAWIQTNFVKGQNGNMLKYGTPLLKIKVPKAVTLGAILAKKNANNGWNFIQAEQSLTPNNPWTNKVVFEMTKKKNGQTIPMDKGQYKVILRAAVLGQGVADVFYIGDK